MEPVLRHDAAPTPSVLCPSVPRCCAPAAKVLAQWLSSAQLRAQSVGPRPARSTPQLLSPPLEPYPTQHNPQRGSVPAGRRKVTPPPWPHPQPDRNRKPRGFLTHPACCSPRRDPGVQGDLATRRNHREPHAFLTATPKEGPPTGRVPECCWAQGAHGSHVLGKHRLRAAEPRATPVRAHATCWRGSKERPPS